MSYQRKPIVAANLSVKAYVASPNTAICSSLRVISLKNATPSGRVLGLMLLAVLIGALGAKPNSAIAA